MADADFWQHNLLAGYRFPRRYAEITLGLINLFDTDYRLSPLNLHPDLPRGRTLAAGLRLNFWFPISRAVAGALRGSLGSGGCRLVPSPPLLALS